jgi:hypothetical protein
MDVAATAQVNAMVEAAMAPAQTMEAVGVAVLGHVLDTATTQNAQLLQMMRSTLDPSVGASVDLFA